MITCVSDGDYVVNNRGKFVDATPIEEIVQRATNCLKIRLGSFLLDPKLGNQLSKLDMNLANKDMIKAYVTEALAKIRELEVVDVLRHNNKSIDAMSLTIYLRVLGQSVTLNI